MAKPIGWAKQAGNQGAAAVRRTPPTRIRDARTKTSGEDPARLAATVGLVCPSGGIVLWDEWYATLKKKGDGENPEAPGKQAPPADTLWLQRAKEVIGDQEKS